MKALHCLLSLTNINIVCDCLGSEQLRKAVGNEKLQTFFFALKGLCHEMNIFLRIYYNKYVLSLHALMVFTIY
jgi:hypothetical protein